MDIFFTGWAGLIKTIVVGICTYGALILLLRVSGKRTLSKMNAFDFVVTVALGSILATTLLSNDTPLAQGVLALVVLISLQFLITWLSVRSKAVGRLVKSEPKLLFHRGQFLWGAMKLERVNEGEIIQAMRSQGVSQISQVEAVVLETDGSLSVVQKQTHGVSDVLSDVSGGQAR